MGKKKKGRLRGRGGQGYNARGGSGNGYHPRPMRPQANGDPAHNQEPADNGEPGPVDPGSGVLELHPNGYGFLRDPTNNYIRELTDPFVPGSMIEKYGLREGRVDQRHGPGGPPPAGPPAPRDLRRRRHAAGGLPRTSRASTS